MEKLENFNKGGSVLVEGPQMVSKRRSAINRRSKTRKGKHCLYCICLVIIILLTVGVFLFYRFWQVGLGRGKIWQAVFLANNQVYFGKIVRETKEVIVLREVYYLREESNLTKEEQTPRFSLVKLGEELHSPEDEMRINKRFVIFVESLKPSSEIVKNIELLKGKNR